MKPKVFILTFIIIYILLSLPVMLGFGWSVEWVQGATFFQKLKVHVAERLFGYWIPKVLIAGVAGIIVSIKVGVKQ
ncbi:MAG: hypothetical protein ACQEV7_13750 [Bacillota bacterium]